MGKYAGRLSTDIGTTIDELRLGVVEYTAAQAIVADADALLADQATAADAVTTVTTFLAQPPFPRSITILPGGTTADVKAGNITVAGTNINDEAITEDVAILADAATAVETTKAFKTVTSISFIAQDGAAATYDVGFGDKLQFPFMSATNIVLDAYLDGVREATFPTVTLDADEIEKNTIDLSSALNGKVVRVLVVQ